MLHKDGRVILVDFGIARSIQQDSDVMKTAIGTMGYTPEEQCLGQAEPRSDLYALGATMHHLLTGENPIPFSFEPIRKHNKNITPELEKVIMKSLKTEVSDRFPSAGDMLEQLNSTREIKKKPSIIRRVFSKASLPYLISFLIIIITGITVVNYFISKWSESPWIAMDSGVNKGLFGISFVDNDTGWATGKEGTIIHTSDGGKTWKKQKTGIDVTLDGVYFSDYLNGWAIGQKWKVGQCVGVTLYTDDGGKTWNKEYTEIPKDFTKIYIDDINNAWAVGDNGTLYHITDKGQKWDQIKTGILDDIYEVRFVDDTNGWLRTIRKTGEMDSTAILLHTTDGGETWENQPTELFNAVVGIDFVNRKEGWITGLEDTDEFSIEGLIKYTDDGGKTWKEQYREKWLFPYSIYFIDNNCGYVLGTRLKGLFGLGATLLRTEDGGKTWKKDNYPYLSCTRFFFLNPDLGWSCGAGGDILKYSRNIHQK